MRVLLVPSSNIRNTKARCRAAVKYWREGNFDVIILAGGTYPNATVMKQWIEEKASRLSDKIIIENKSLDTYQNIANSLKIIKARYPGRDIDEIGVVTNWQHGIRVRISLMFGYDIKQVKILPSQEPVTIKQWCLEWVFILIHLLDPRGDNVFAHINRAHRRITVNPSSAKGYGGQAINS